MSAAQRRHVLQLVPTGELEGSPYPKCSLFLRGMARLIDTAMAYAFYVVGQRAGLLSAFLFVLFADGMLNGQSLGKRLCGIRVVHLPTRSSARYRDSVLRNSPFGLVVLLAMMPQPLGFRAFVFGAIVVGTVEAWKVIREALGMRLGDVWAQTQVVDGKVVAGSSLVERTHVVETAPSSRMMSAARVRRGVGNAGVRRNRCGSRSPTT